MAPTRRRSQSVARKSYYESSDDGSTDSNEIIPNYANGADYDEDSGYDSEEQLKEGKDSDQGDVSNNNDQMKVVSDFNVDNHMREHLDVSIAQQNNSNHKEKKVAVPVVPKDADEDEAFSDSEESSDESAPVEKKQKTKKEPLVCPHCKRTFAAKHTLQSHVNKKVCQKKEDGVSVFREEIPAAGEDAREGIEAGQDKAGRKQTKRKRRTKKDAAVKKSKNRGAACDRTCPRCNRVFTSILGFQYHRDKKVCDKRNKQTEIPFYSLKPGQQFITKYGVVEVIRDVREIPLPTPTSDLQAKMKRFTSTRVKRDMQWKKRVATAQINSATCRRILSKYYEKHAVTQEHVLDAYDLEALGEARMPQKPTDLPPGMPPDPTTPEGSYPDRIVECKWIVDTRPREEGETWSEMEGRPTNIFEGNLFLQRRLLTSPYSAETPRIYCPRCWQCFMSKSGYRHHYDKRSCVLWAEKSAADKQILASSVDFRVRQKIQHRFRHRKELLGEMLGLDHVEGNCSVGGDREGEDAGDLTFDGEKTDARPRKKKYKPAPKRVLSEKVKGVIAVKPLKSKVVEPIVSPDVLLLELQSEYQLLQGRLLGSVYPEVWKSLGFKKPPKRRKRRSISMTTQSKKVRKSSARSAGENDMVPLALSQSNAPKTVPFSASLHCFGEVYPAAKDTSSLQLEQTQECTGTNKAARNGDNTIVHADRPTKAVLNYTSASVSPCQTTQVEKQNNVVANDSLSRAIDPMSRNNAMVIPEKNTAAAANPPEMGVAIASRNLPSHQVLHPQNQITSEPTTSENSYSRFVQIAAMQPYRDPSNPPQMIDIRMFIGEVDSGRFPSMKRHTGAHDEVCVICRSKVSLIHAQSRRAAQLLPCTYCRQSVHFNCVGTRYKLKFPEPNEEFMCHHCISMVCQRRKRAEKRRLEKLGQEFPSEAQEQEERDKRFKRATKLIPGEEFECVSEQGKRCEDLGVLLRDARSRLDVSLKISRGNDARKQLIQAMEGMK